MNHNDDNLDLIEEIYLTEDKTTQWLATDMPRADCFKVKGELLLLNNMDPLYVPPPVPGYDLQQLVNRAFSKPLDYWERNWDSIHTSRPVIRKLERPCDATWTLFRHTGLVIGVHDDGTVVARDIAILNAHEFCITTGGDFHCHGRVQEYEDLKNPEVVIRVAAIQDAVRLWVERAKGREYLRDCGACGGA